MIHKAYKFRIYPNKTQEMQITKTIGCSRFVFNHFLEAWNTAYRETPRRGEELPSSQLCSRCGYQNKAAKDLGLRT